MGFLYGVLWLLKVLWIVLSETINIFRKLHKTNISGMHPKMFTIELCTKLNLVAMKCWTLFCILNWFYGGLRSFSDVWSKNAPLFERLIEIDLYLPIYYGFKKPVDVLYHCKKNIYTVEPRYNKVLGTMKITLLYQDSHNIRVKKQRNIKSWDQENYLVIRGFCYIRPLYNEVPLYMNWKYMRCEGKLAFDDIFSVSVLVNQFANQMLSHLH